MKPTDTLIWDFQYTELQENKFLLFKLLDLWYLVRKPKQTNTMTQQEPKVWEPQRMGTLKIKF